MSFIVGTISVIALAILLYKVRSSRLASEVIKKFTPRRKTTTKPERDAWDINSTRDTRIERIDFSMFDRTYEDETERRYNGGTYEAPSYSDYNNGRAK